MSLCPGRPQRTELRSHPWGMNNPGTREWIALGLRGFLKIREPIFPSSRYMVCWSQHHPIRHSQLMQASVVQLLSHVRLFQPMDCSSPGFTILHHLLEPAQAYVHQISDAIQPSHPLSCPSPPAFNLSQYQGLFWWVSSSHYVAKVLELQHQSFQWIFRADFLWIDWFLLLAVQGTLKGLLQHHSSKASILWCQGFFMFLFSIPFMATGKTIVFDRVLTIWTLVAKVMSLLFNTLYRFVRHFLPMRKHRSISWLQSPFAVISKPKKIKSVTVSIVFPSISHEVMGPDAMIFVFWMLSFKPAFSISFTSIKRLFLVPLCFQS